LEWGKKKIPFKTGHEKTEMFPVSWCKRLNRGVTCKRNDMGLWDVKSGAGKLESDSNRRPTANWGELRVRWLNRKKNVGIIGERDYQSEGGTQKKT